MAGAGSVHHSTLLLVCGALQPHAAAVNITVMLVSLACGLALMGCPRVWPAQEYGLPSSHTLNSLCLNYAAVWCGGGVAAAHAYCTRILLQVLVACDCLLACCNRGPGICARKLH